LKVSVLTSGILSNCISKILKIKS